MITLSNVSKTYQLGGEDIHALDKASLTIKTGEFVAIMGPSGSGKSTFANLVGGLDQPDSGQIKVDDVDISTLRDRALSAYRNKTIGFVFQTFNLQPNYTALENVQLPLIFQGMRGRARREKALACLTMVGLADRANHKPNQLSGGQRQRVAIARAIANDPTIILADEPTGNLDSKRGSEIISLLKELNKKNGLTLIVITHDASVAKAADRTITIKDGRVS